VIRRHGVAALIAAIATVVGAARSASAFCRTTRCGKDCAIDPVTGCPDGEPIAWPQYCVSYSLQYQASSKVDLETATNVTATAFAAWQTAICPGGGIPSIQLDQSFGPVACKSHEYNQIDGNANVILFHDDEWPYAATPDVLALTTVTFSKKTGDIYDVDIEINGLQPLSTSDEVDVGSYDLQSIVTHEAGHFLGLAHSLDPDATMWAQYSMGTASFRDLSDDDIAGICNVYPPSSAEQVCDFSPRQGFSPECGIYPAGNGSCSVAPASLAARGSNGGALAVLAASALALARRRRGRQLGR
jgi:hypothetical protein